MPCFKGIAVSIHTRDGPLPEYSIQKQARANRISSYIPVPPPRFTEGSDLPEPPSFAISITLLTPGSVVPYSKPDATLEEPDPLHKYVGGLPGAQGPRGTYSSVIQPYIPLTSSPNETLAAYIFFDGRVKEEVATLLRRGVETWVNSRWVGVPESEGGGLAEREFLFREVGLERWLNGLDLKGESKDVQARIEKRKQRLERRRQKKLASPDSDDDLFTKEKHNGMLRYIDGKTSPIDDSSADEGVPDSGSDSDDDIPEVEATGQIKISLFRVMASGEIKKGEYSPSFDAHDDDDEGMQASGDDPGVDHTTTFAKPKTLDPKSISTQTVTGIDSPNDPFATFTFFYRGDRRCAHYSRLIKGQLQKMGILPTPEVVEKKEVRKKSRQIDLSKLGPLKSQGTVGFAGYRDPTQASNAKVNGKRVKEEDDMDSDNDDLAAKSSTKPKDEDKADLEENDKEELSAEELARRAELAEGVKKIQLKRQLSTDALGSGSTKVDEKAPLASAATLSAPARTAARLGEHAPSASPFKRARNSVSIPEPKSILENISPKTAITNDQTNGVGAKNNAELLATDEETLVDAGELDKADSPQDIPQDTQLKGTPKAVDEEL